jgi:hypothetical protein
MPNPDGTVQVAPPTQSAFAQPGGAPPPVQPAPQVSSAPQPGFMEALMALFHQLAGSVNPARQVTQRPRVVDQAVEDAEGLGNQFRAGR